jgi:hypothetical protein
MSKSKNKNKLTPEESAALIRRLLYEGYNSSVPINIRTRSAGGGGLLDMSASVPDAIRAYVHIDDFMLFLTKLSEDVLDDNKQMAYRGLRDLLEALKYNRLVSGDDDKS